MSDIQLKRTFVYEMYSGRGWKAKVNRMSDAQIIAIFLREQKKILEAQAEKDADDEDPIPF